ncbi:hypothetical protein RIF29_32535 [Crotalaria pallida]|uniref:Transmembrane protein n=1 Tax=Crotalaria pallida TaxID=3830 RepID=A0AAN9EIA4_CROPI
MRWFQTKRRGGPEMLLLLQQQQQGLTEHTMTTFSLSPTLHLLIILSIVISLLWLSHYTDHKAQSHHSALNFQFFLLVSPILLILFFISYSTSGRLNFDFTSSKHHALKRRVVSPI